jgi:hypothetical protein
MPWVAVDEFAWDDENEEHIADHGLTPRQVDQVLDDDYVVDWNRQGRRAEYLLIGRDYGGRCITVAIEGTTDLGRWRPVTAWPSKPSEEARLRQQRRSR